MRIVIHILSLAIAVGVFFAIYYGYDSYGQVLREIRRSDTLKQYVNTGNLRDLEIVISGVLAILVLWLVEKLGMMVERFLPKSDDH